MGFYPDVSPGDRVRHSAKRENDISHLLNCMNGFGGGKNVLHTDRLTVQVYNAGSSVLPYGAAVNFVSSGAAMAGNAIPCSAATDTALRWGVLTTRLEPRQGGTCVVAGPVSVTYLEGSGGECAAPKISSGAAVYSSGAQVYSRGGDGAPIIYAGASGGVILLGAGGGNGAGVELAAVVTMPTPPLDNGAVAPVGIGSGGAVTITSGANIPAVFPFLDGYN